MACGQGAPSSLENLKGTLKTPLKSPVNESFHPESGPEFARLHRSSRAIRLDVSQREPPIFCTSA
jgi:hypothetical protein